MYYIYIYIYKYVIYYDVVSCFSESRDAASPHAKNPQTKSLRV